jgi:putative spermidine/putrescine transport system substrate-binding protein/spermidine/putrescine transport system substrate-binding protein
MIRVRSRKGAIAAIVVAASSAVVVGATVSAASTAGSTLASAGCKVTGPLNAILWEGYAAQPMQAAFEKKYGIKINVTYIGSNDEVFAKIRSRSGQYDLVPATTDISHQYIDQRLVQPIDLGQIPNASRVFPQFKNLPQATKNGATYGVAHTWSADPILYNPKVVKNPTASYSILWDKRYAGKVALYDDIGSLWVGAMVKHYPPFTMSSAQLADDVKFMQQQKSLDRKYWSTGDDLVKLFASGEVVLATGWNYMYTQLRSQHVPIARLVPKEGNLGWVDTLMIPANAKHACAAEKWIDWAISGGGGAYTANASGYSISNPAINAHLTKQQVSDLHMSDPAFMRKIVLWRPVDRPKYQDAWNKVKNG